MTELKNIKDIYFIGIGGIGMSALARYFHAKGVMVSGYDKTSTELTKELEREGIPVHYEDNIDLVPKQADLVVYTPAIPTDHKELNFYRENNYKLMKRSEVLGIISNNSFNICVAGTHGKTTISTMIAHILRHTSYGCNAFLGGISANYQTNFWSSDRNVCVIEADEYDRSFLQLSPDIAIISAMDPDHLDIYGSEEALQEAFIDFSKKLKPDGMLLNKFGLKKGSALKAANHFTYSRQNESANVYADNLTMNHGSYHFDVVIKGNLLKNMVLHMGGMYNVENAVVAIAVAYELGIEVDLIRAAVEAFKGVKRRFEYIVKTDRLVFIDDYAHHPEELSALIN
ncbi:MAG TPA: Mur ligase family protein, partial [Chitinophagaceae bacterium]|nr:Mur ligase family protein [Chitinophagaceae bacterium]